ATTRASGLGNLISFTPQLRKLLKLERLHTITRQAERLLPWQRSLMILVKKLISALNISGTTKLKLKALLVTYLLAITMPSLTTTLKKMRPTTLLSYNYELL